jgi:hypothetical protein
MSARPFRVCVISALVVLGAARASTADPVVIYSNFGPPPGYLSQGWLSSEENAYYMGFQLTEAALLRSVAPSGVGRRATGRVRCDRVFLERRRSGLFGGWTD